LTSGEDSAASIAAENSPTALSKDLYSEEHRNETDSRMRQVLEKDAAGGDQNDPMDTDLIPWARMSDPYPVEPGHPSLFFGTIMLSELREAVSKAGINAELANGVLYVENPESGAVVLVRKIGPQSLVLEGAICEEYYTVRTVLYDALGLATYNG
jgi:Cleavage and polyadenylation factor 2 C-terminal